MKSKKVTGRALSHEQCADLVRSAASGDAASLERLLKRAQEVAGRFSRSVCGHAGDAEDAVQEALIRTYRNVGRIRDPEAFRPWLYRTVRNACLVGRRKRSGEPARISTLDDTLPGFSRTPEQLADAAALRRQLRRALRALPGPYREVVFLRELEGLSTQEVARVTGISEDNVKTRLRRARGQLRQILGGNPPHPSAH
ncbi:MAG TPA: RNA polymerase sigma factor [Vicinamibacterales bacterium]|nr:RNA polymerase sigma factor [Vicinamibacterales bacterium]